MYSTDHMHLQRFCERRNRNKTIGLHKKLYIWLGYTLNIFHLNHWEINETKEKKSAVLGRFIVTRFKVFKKENEMTESSFL